MSHFVESEFDLTTRQGVFDHVATALFKQGKPASNDVGGCQYRTDDGLKCAVGCLIPDEDYVPEAESVGAVDEAPWGEHPALIAIDGRVRRTPGVLTLLADMQSAHDFAAYADFLPAFKERMVKVAKDRRLNTRTIKRIYA